MSDADLWAAALGERSDPLSEAREREQTRAHRHAAVRDRRERAHSDKRRDIQGLRMVAVVAVVVNHLTGHPVGGFVGVDVFFVISGYLITSHLLREFVRTRRISVSGFYRKRIRRLLPAAITVTVLTVLAAKTIYTAARFHTTFVDGLWATAFWANWHSISTGTDYFAASLPPSPFQHYWSLSVEEQYYVVWPVALFFAGWLTLRLVRASDDQHRGMRMLGGAILASLMLLLSLGYGLHLSSADPVRAYFSTFTRAWELGLGSLLACVVPFMRGNRQLLTAMSWAGTAMIGLSLFVVHGSTEFPVPGAVLPCVGSALVIAAATSSAQASNALLTNPLAVYVGDISYSVYLVHFPVIILLAAKMPGLGAYYYVSAVLLTVGLSIGLYAAVERPVLQSRWLLPSGEPTRRRHRSDRTRMKVSLATSAVCVAASLAAIALWPGTQTQSGPLARAIADQAGQSAPPVSTALPRLQTLSQQIGAALQAKKWPALHPSMDAVMSGPKAPADLLPCGAIQLAPAEECTFGSPSAKHVAVLVGDSLSMAYAEAFKDFVAQTPGWRVRIAGAFGCQFTTDVRFSTVTSWQSACRAHDEQAISAIRALHPDLVVVTNTTGPETDAAGHDLSHAEWAGRLQREIARFSGDVGKVVILPPPPWQKQIAECYTRGSSPIDCVSQASPWWYARTQAESQVASDLHGVFIDPMRWFCDQAGLCPSFVGHVPTKQDLEHPSAAYMDLISPVILETLRSHHLFG